MAKRTMMIMAFALISSVFAAGAFAQVTVSGGFALSSIDRIRVTGGNSPSIDTDTGLGGNIYADYLLPVSIPVSLGFEFGVDSAKFTLKQMYNMNTNEYFDPKETVTVIPLLVRVAYHFDLMAKLDLYVVGKIGYAIGFWDGEYKDYAEKNNYTIDDMGGVAFGFDVGAAYYFSSTLGIFAEVGFDNYALEGDISTTGYSGTLEAPFSRFLTFGVSLKF